MADFARSFPTVIASVRLITVGSQPRTPFRSVSVTVIPSAELSPGATSESTRRTQSAKSAAPSLSPLHRQVAARVPDKDLTWTRDFLFGVDDHLLPLREPTDCARDGEHHGEHRDRQTHRLIDDAGIKIDVRVEFARDEIFVLERDALEFQRDIEQPIAPGHLEHFLRYPFDDARAGIIIFVNAMPETHQPAFAVFNALDEVGNVARVADAREHFEHFFIRAAVQRTV